MAKPAAGPDAFRKGLDADRRAMVEVLTRLILKAAPALTEDFKWNAPSFRTGETHCVTFNLPPKGGVRLVLHRDAKTKDASGFSFSDPDKLADWPSVDRGVLAFATLQEIEAVSGKLESLVGRWVKAAA